MDMADVPPNNRAAWEVARRQAGDRLSDLERNYVRQLQAQSVVIAPFGPGDKATEFGDIASSEEGLVASAVDLYEGIAQDVEKTVGFSRTWGVSQYSETVQRALEAARTAGVQELQHDTSAPFTPRAVPDHDAVVEAVRDTVRKALGDDVARAYLFKRLKEVAMSANLPENAPVAVAILGARDAQEAQALLGGWPAPASAILDLDENDLSREAIVAAFQKTKKFRS